MTDFYDETLKIRPNIIVLNRHYHQNCTTGVMKFPDGTTFHTMELPWKNNRNRVSCIPEGFYPMQKRVSGVVQRTSGYTQGWEVQEVKDRDYIMVHVGNYPSDFEGCIGVGTGSAVYSNDNRMITSSRKAFRQFMDVMEQYDEWLLVVREAQNAY